MPWAIETSRRLTRLAAEDDGHRLTVASGPAAVADFFSIESGNPRSRQEVALGNPVLAGEQLSDAFFGFMNGAAETGRLAATAIVRRIQRRT